ncbi:MAG: hypothetical protein EBR24_06405 [Flavobacteriia bacterium]|nr:hypothetical protein [Flavobacteriia bacterium]
MSRRLLLFIAFTVTSVFGNTQTIIIGKQVWSTKNLDVSSYKNGDQIPEAKTKEEWIAFSKAMEGAWCYYENDKKNGKKYGKLYNCYAVNDSRGLAPEGYHIPSDDEWMTLANYLGGLEKAGVKMKSKEGWSNNSNGTNSSGFSALPGGFRWWFGDFQEIGNTCNWWSSTEDSSYEETGAVNQAFQYGINETGGKLYRNSIDRSCGYSVRYIKD